METTPQYSNEVWKPIAGYEAFYEVSTHGRVRSLRRRMMSKIGKEWFIEPRIIKPFPDSQGYQLVGLHFGGKVKNRLVHRLVAETFIPNPHNKEQVDHINTIKTDCRLENLRWVTPSENQQNPISKIHQSIVRIGKNRGKDNPKAKAVYQIDLNGNVIKRWESMQDVYRALGFNVPDIIKCCKGIRRTSRGFKWQYCEKTNL